MLNTIAHKPLKLAILICFLAMLTACQVPESQQAPESSSQPVTPDRKVSALLEQAVSAEPAEASKLNLRAGQILLANESFEEARAVLYRIEPSQLKEQKDRIRLVFSLAQLALSTGDSEEARAVLDSPRYAVTNLTDQQLQAFELLKAELDEYDGRYLSALERRVNIFNLLRGSEKSGNLELIWNNALSLDNAELNQALASRTGDTKAWLELAAIYRYHQNDLEDQIAQLNNWLNLNSGHPAARNLPRSLEVLKTAAENVPSRVAVLLPVSGKYKAYAKAIETGILARYYTSLERNLSTPVINFYDSSSNENFLQVYQQAIDEGAELIIGPLDKTNVETLEQQEKLPVPTLALNITDAIKQPENLFYFGLSAEDEVLNIAKKAASDGHQKAAIIYPDSDWGKRVMSRFTRSWYDEKGQIIISQPYEKSQPLGQYVKSMLNINQSEQRANRIRWMLSEKLMFEPRRRQDIDFILLLATPKQARQIKPALNFHYAKNLPVYATSQVYEGKVQPDKDRDLNGVQFIDMPWILTNEHPLKGILYDESNPGSPQLVRLTAMGVDAYSLISRLSALKAAPESRVYGATGTLQLTEENILSRKLHWAFFSGGKARLLPTIVTR